MHYLWMFIVGLVVGVVAKFLTPGKDPGGFIVTGLLGVGGMFVGGLLSNLFFGSGSIGGPIQPSGFIGGVIGAVILLLLYRLFTRNSGTPSS
ncbi:MAG TPA: GlsB/YeaQ/YmgE family stress response membrane protein [Rhodanobacteraceae bacterium]|nr:GlsB/YeaQ/YmgE family stress response membrane protein [Rhodanobacteraceae bacterium]